MSLSQALAEGRSPEREGFDERKYDFLEGAARTNNGRMQQLKSVRALGLAGAGSSSVGGGRGGNAKKKKIHTDKDESTRPKWERLNNNDNDNDNKRKLARRQSFL